VRKEGEGKMAEGKGRKKERGRPPTHIPGSGPAAPCLFNPHPLSSPAYAPTETRCDYKVEAGVIQRRRNSMTVALWAAVSVTWQTASSWQPQTREQQQQWWPWKKQRTRYKGQEHDNSRVISVSCRPRQVRCIVSE